MKSQHSRLNLENRRYEVPAKLIHLLAVDTSENEPLACQIDFEKHNCDRKLVNSGKAGHWNVKYFVSRWLQLQGRLADGTKYSLVMSVKHQDRHRTKRSASGKLKHKTKTKTSQEIVLKLKIKQKRYPLLKDVTADARSAIQLPENAAVKSFDVSADGLNLTVTLMRAFSATKSNEPQVVQATVELVTAMMLSLYQVLNLSKAIEKA